MSNTPKAEANPTVLVKCRRGSDPSTGGQSCDSLQAEKLTNVSSSVTFKCKKCNYVWTIQTGGFINI